MSGRAPVGGEQGREQGTGAAGRRGADGPARLRQSLLRPTGRQVVVAALLAVLGFGAATQVSSRSDDTAYRGARTDELVSLLAGQAAARERADLQIARLEADREQLLGSNDSRTAALRRTRDEVERLGLLAGSVPAVGPGVRITVSGPVEGVGINQLLNGVQELRDSGAEVLEVDQRIRLVASSWLEEASEGVVVDGLLVRPPYVIEAIGDPGTLAAGLDFTGGFVDDVEERGGEVQVEQLGEVRVESVVNGG